MGSGHILVYAFDVLMQIFLSQGYTERDAASLIIEKNLYGADIDKRAYQLSYFALMMKGRAYTLQVCLDSGAKKILMPAISMADFASVPDDLSIPPVLGGITNIISQLP